MLTAGTHTGWTHLSALALVVVLGAAACGAHPDAKEGAAMDPTVRPELELVASQRIYFGHMSVGRNLLAGVQDLASAHGVALKVVAPPDVPGLEAAGFLAESGVGANRSPNSKCDDFTRILEKLPGIDIALMKFCYVDFEAPSDPDAMFRYYRTTMDRLRDRHPNTSFVHVTAPLRVRPNGPRAIVKRMLGHVFPWERDNARANHFNRLLRDHFRSDPVFDLAAAESTYPDGKRSRFNLDGQEVFSLAAPYTDDGGHLNATGRRVAARVLVKVLAEVARSRVESLPCHPST